MKWTTKVIYVDLETGETLLQQQVKENYTPINTRKKTYINAKQTRGTIELTIGCIKRKYIQTKLFTNT